MDAQISLPEQPAAAAADLSAADIVVLSVRELTQDQMQDLAWSDVDKPGASAIFYRHRLLAQLIARGLNDHEIAAATNMSPQSVRGLRNKPHMQELVVAFQNEVVQELLEPRARIRDTMLQSLDLLQQRMDSPEAASIPTNALTDIFQKTADRCGFAPVAKSVQVSGKLTRDEINAILAEAE